MGELGRACVGQWMEQPRSIDDGKKPKKKKKKLQSTTGNPDPQPPMNPKAT
jgi:hypothetical protein